MKIKRHFTPFFLKNKWNSLYKDNSYYTTFQSWKLYKILYLYYFPYVITSRTYPIFYEIIKDNKTILIAPISFSFSKKNHNKYLFGEYRDTTILGDYPGMAILDFIYSQKVDKELLFDAFQLLMDHLKGKNVSFSRLTKKSYLKEFLDSKKNPVKLYENVLINFEQHNYDDYYQNLSKNSRQNIRTAYNRLKKNELNFRLVFYDKKHKMPKKVRKRIMELYIKRRLERYHDSGKLYSYFSKYFHFNSIGQKKLQNSCSFVFYINGEVASFMSGYIDNQTIIIPRLAINSKFYKFSPGILMLNESVKYLCDLKTINSIDLLKGAEKYKLTMGGEIYNTYRYDLKL